MALIRKSDCALPNIQLLCGLLSSGVVRVVEHGYRPIIENLVKLAAQAANAEGGSLYLLNDEGTHLEKAYVTGLPESYTAGCGPVAVGAQCCGRAVEHNKPWIVTDMQNDPLFADAKQASLESGIRAGFSVPVRDRSGKAIGSLACHYRRVYTPSSNDLERNEMFAGLIGFALTEENPSTGHLQIGAD